MDLRLITKNELYQLQKDKLEELIEHAGGIKHLAFMLNLPLPTLNSCQARGRVSKEIAHIVENHPSLGEHFKAVDLRPDLTMS